jgi:hypothetical protein
MKPEDIKKLKFALFLVLLFVLLKSLNELGVVSSGKAFVTSLVAGAPITFLMAKLYGRLEGVSGTIKRSIAYVSVPLGLILWRWLHVVSKYYETVLVLILCYILILTIFNEKQKGQSSKSQ